MSNILHNRCVNMTHGMLASDKIWNGIAANCTTKHSHFNGMNNMVYYLFTLLNVSMLWRNLAT